MKKLFKRLVHEERGASAVIVAAAIVVLLVFAAFAVDFGIAYFQTAKAQNAADAATLAAVIRLPINQDDAAAIAQAKDTAIEYVNKNGDYTISQDNVELGDLVYGKYTSVRVNIPGQVDLTFARVIGMNTINFTRNAKAIISPSQSVIGAAPLGVEREELQQAIESGNLKDITLKYGGGDGTMGTYGAIDLDGVKGGGAKDFESWLTYGYSGSIRVGDTLLPVEKGNMAGPTESSITQRYNKCTHYQSSGGCTAEHFELDCPRLIKVLVIDYDEKYQYVQVRGFALFLIEDITNIKKGEVNGSYVKALDDSNADENVDWPTSEYGLYSISLSE